MLLLYYLSVFLYTYIHIYTHIYTHTLTHTQTHKHTHTGVLEGEEVMLKVGVEELRRVMGDMERGCETRRRGGEEELSRVQHQAQVRKSVFMCVCVYMYVYVCEGGGGGVE
jgi:hypothetical protein